MFGIDPSRREAPSRGMKIIIWHDNLRPPSESFTILSQGMGYQMRDDSL